MRRGDRWFLLRRIDILEQIRDDPFLRLIQHLTAGLPARWRRHSALVSWFWLNSARSR
jgi:hypothetical protein